MNGHYFPYHSRHNGCYSDFQDVGNGKLGVILFPTHCGHLVRMVVAVVRILICYTWSVYSDVSSVVYMRVELEVCVVRVCTLLLCNDM